MKRRLVIHELQQRDNAMHVEKVWLVINILLHDQTKVPFESSYSNGD